MCSNAKLYNGAASPVYELCLHLKDDFFNRALALKSVSQPNSVDTENDPTIKKRGPPFGNPTGKRGKGKGKFRGIPRHKMLAAANAKLAPTNAQVTNDPAEVLDSTDLGELSDMEVDDSTDLS
jgi:hypothetical protein